ncbi:MAG: hypothetical protein A2591_00570 [Candidatus Yonathbacteria bacterium RIFOXYD1_FULL_52_36]|uniref:Peptidase M16 n=1 Tax=Candidatus Yonathbacteria bacterium RIFOXYD1_FULL_52_36 TaxID=1802730 RepID=A0A1G2SN21_9BACT|nr:MAG: hypothetical protein A2591_00570 [Candidatus Yonathbacteria bacterium RIFOXYD1_FULL_52_36]
MKATKTTLKNGIRLVTIPIADAPTATVLVLVETGSKYEDKRINGLSHFLEHMCFKGTTNRPSALDITKELDGLGAQYNAFTGQEYTGYYAKGEASRLAKLLDIVSDIYLNSTLPADEIEKEKGVIVQEINMYEDMPHRHVHDVFMNLLYGDQPAGWNIAGTPEIVRSLTREDFMAYRGKQYVPEATIVVVAGAIDPRTVKADVQKLFAGVSAGKKGGKKKVLDKQSAPAARIEKRETDQTHLVLGVRAKPVTHPDHFVLEVLAGILGGGMSSRLFQRIRTELGAAYYVRAWNDASTDHGIFGVSVGAGNEQTKDVVRATLEEMARLTREPVSREELEKVKMYLTGHLYLELESSDSLANFYGMQEVLTKEMLSAKDTATRIRAVTPEDIRRVAKSIFKDTTLNLALIGPFEKESEFLSLLTFPK